MADIRLMTRGLVALLDDEDVPLVENMKWYPAFRGLGICYAMAVVGGKSLLMHRVLLPDAKTVDHRNRNGLDNRRENLRACTQAQNMANQRPQFGRGSRFKGVHWAAGKWRAQLITNGRHVHLGRFTSEIEAAIAYNVAALNEWGEFARLNDLEVPDVP